MTDRLFENFIIGRGIFTVDVLIELDALYELNQEILRLLNEELK